MQAPSTEAATSATQSHQVPAKPEPSETVWIGEFEVPTRSSEGEPIEWQKFIDPEDGGIWLFGKSRFAEFTFDEFGFRHYDPDSHDTGQKAASSTGAVPKWSSKKVAGAQRAMADRSGQSASSAGSRAANADHEAEPTPLPYLGTMFFGTPEAAAAAEKLLEATKITGTDKDEE
jgi:hypothetical protein